MKIIFKNARVGVLGDQEKGTTGLMSSHPAELKTLMRLEFGSGLQWYAIKSWVTLGQC